MTENPRSSTSPPVDLRRYAWLSIAAAVGTIALKGGAWALTGSVGLLSDAAESLVNLAAALMALYTLTVAARPADHDHMFGHSKAEYFSAAVEGLMIMVAAGVIIFTAVERLLDPQPISNVGIGLAISVVASILNGAVALVLIRAGRQHRSMTLVADGKHLMTDVWTSVGVVVGVLLVGLTGWEILDPVVALAVGVNIIVTGTQLIRESVSGLMDKAWDPDESAELASVLGRFRGDDVDFHGLRTRVAGAARFAEVHVLVPGDWTVQRAHDIVEDVEAAVDSDLAGNVQIVCHVEPREDPRAYGDVPVEIRHEHIGRGGAGD